MIEAEQRWLMAMEQKQREIKLQLVSIGNFLAGYAWRWEGSEFRRWFRLDNLDCQLRMSMSRIKQERIQGFMFYLTFVVMVLWMILDWEDCLFFFSWFFSPFCLRSFLTFGITLCCFWCTIPSSLVSGLAPCYCAARRRKALNLPGRDDARPLDYWLVSVHLWPGLFDNELPAHRRGWG